MIKHDIHVLFIGAQFRRGIVALLLTKGGSVEDIYCLGAQFKRGIVALLLAKGGSVEDIYCLGAQFRRVTLG